MLDGRSLIDAASDLARSVGLGLGGAASLSACGDERLRAWIDAGYAASLGYIVDRAAILLDPLTAFAPYRSVLSFFAEHTFPEPSRDPTIGNIARYALGDDYHDVLKKRLFSIGDGLRAIDPDLAYRAMVDTAPLLEKRAAAAAGLGWQGKHSNIIRRDRGSWFFLAELLVDRDVPAPASEKDRCGICDACLRACPTGAIVAPYVVDAGLCISYLTIELRGAIPRHLRPLIGHRIFGCDDCQEVCPWNRFAKESPIAEFRARGGLRERTLLEWLEIGEDGWRAVFKNSAVKRTKYAGFMRNVAVAIGNARETRSLAVIEREFSRFPPIVREHLAWAIGEIGGRDSVEVARRLSAEETEPVVLEELRLVAAAGRESTGRPLSKGPSPE